MPQEKSEIREKFLKLVQQVPILKENIKREATFHTELFNNSSLWESCDMILLLVIRDLIKNAKEIKNLVLIDNNN